MEAAHSSTATTGCRSPESGAFLLGRPRGSRARVTTFVCYDTLDPNAYDGGAIAFHADGYAAFWAYCRETKLQVLADVHTHPGGNVSQSRIDRRNPMVPMVGHIGLIVPDFAHTRWWSLAAVGVYEYLGDFNWRPQGASVESRRFRLTLW